MWQSLLNSTISSGVSLDLETSWAAKSLRDALIHAKYDVGICFQLLLIL